MGGQIGVESEPGKGSTFWFRLPLPCQKLKADGAETLTETEVAIAEARPPTPLPDADSERGYRILFAEDNPTNQFLAAALFKRSELHVDFVEDGLAALEALQRESYDLVLMDVQMPQMDGIEATRQIRAGQAGETNTNLPILAVTAHTLPEDRQKCLAAGMNGYLPKPINRTAMFELITAHLPKGPAADRRLDNKAREAGEPLLFDRESFIERVLGDIKIARQVAERAREDFSRQIIGVKEALQAADADKLHFYAHGLKGLALLVECHQLAQLAQTIQMLPKDQMIAEATKQLDALHSRVQAALDALGDFCENQCSSK
jgi:CheY-like chemotaxis protein